MGEPSASAFRRHFQVAAVAVAAVLVIGAGFALVSAVQQARTAARRSSDL